MSWSMTDRTMIKRYGLSGHPCLIPAATVPCVVVESKPCTLKVGLEYSDEIAASALVEIPKR